MESKISVKIFVLLYILLSFIIIIEGSFNYINIEVEIKYSFDFAPAPAGSIDYIPLCKEESLKIIFANYILITLYLLYGLFLSFVFRKNELMVSNGVSRFLLYVFMLVSFVGIIYHSLFVGIHWANIGHYKDVSPIGGSLLPICNVEFFRMITFGLLIIIGYGIFSTILSIKYLIKSRNHKTLVK